MGRYVYGVHVNYAQQRGRDLGRLLSILWRVMEAHIPASLETPFDGLGSILNFCREQTACLGVVAYACAAKFRSNTTRPSSAGSKDRLRNRAGFLSAA